MYSVEKFPSGSRRPEFQANLGQSKTLSHASKDSEDGNDVSFTSSQEKGKGPKRRRETKEIQQSQANVWTSCRF